MYRYIIKISIYLILCSIAISLFLNISGSKIVKYIFEYHKWKFILPKSLPKKIILVSVETVEEDSLLLYSFAGQIDLFDHYLITKDETFGEFFYLKSMFYVDRSKKNNLVNYVSNFLNQKKKFIFALFPEGATRNVKKWHSGFYYIAKQTGASIGTVAIDHATKSVFIDIIFEPSDSYKNDLKKVKNSLRKFPTAIPDKCSLFNKGPKPSVKYDKISPKPIYIISGAGIIFICVLVYYLMKKFEKSSNISSNLKQ